MKKILLFSLLNIFLLTSCSHAPVQTGETLEGTPLNTKHSNNENEGKSVTTETSIIQDENFVYNSYDYPINDFTKESTIFSSNTFNVVYDPLAKLLTLEKPDGSSLNCPEELKCNAKVDVNYWLTLQRITTPGLKKIIYPVNSTDNNGFFVDKIDLFNIATGDNKTVVELPQYTHIRIDSWNSNFSKLAIEASNNEDEAAFPSGTLLYILNFDQADYVSTDIYDINILIFPDSNNFLPQPITWLDEDEVEYQAPANSGDILYVPYTLNLTTGKIYASK